MLDEELDEAFDVGIVVIKTTNLTLSAVIFLTSKETIGYVKMSVDSFGIHS
jgi:hypothetical protein